MVLQAETHSWEGGQETLRDLHIVMVGLDGQAPTYSVSPPIRI